MPNNPLDDELLKELGLEPREPSPSKPAPPRPAPGNPLPPRRPAPPTAPSPVGSAPVGSAPVGSSPVGSAAQPRAPVNPQSKPLPPVSPSPAQSTPMQQEISNLAKDMPIQVVAVLGKKTMPLRDVLSLKQGEVLELKKLPQEMIDLVANGKLMARGELVMVDGRLGIQIKQILG